MNTVIITITNNILTKLYTNNISILLNISRKNPHENILPAEWLKNSKIIIKNNTTNKQTNKQQQ